MRSASMPLFGFEETRISGSPSATPRILSPVAVHRAEGARQPLLETLRGAVTPQTGDDEHTQSRVHFRARLTVGTELDVGGEIFLPGFGERSIKEEVDGAAYIVTKHQCSFPPR